jgi:hypothetical protein
MEWVKDEDDEDNEVPQILAVNLEENCVLFDSGDVVPISVWFDSDGEDIEPKPENRDQLAAFVVRYQDSWHVGIYSDTTFDSSGMLQ